MKKKRLSFLFTVLSVVLLLSSCTSQRKVAYFRSVDASSAEAINAAFNNIHEAKVCVGDMLSIVVSGIDPITVAPFNLPVVAYETPGSDRLYTSPVLQAYLVDVNGNIDFPSIGTINLVGLTKSQAIAKIQKGLEPFLKDPIVTIKFLNYKISVNGEVARPGNYTINNERVTILDALAMAGDMTIYGKRDNVLIIRENFGELEFARLNLNSDEVFTSSYYYLQQNDVIYVEPNNVKAISGLNIPLYLSAITTLGSIVSVIIAVSK
jgi:polysaccharide export outer membrane protein